MVTEIEVSHFLCPFVHPSIVLATTKHNPHSGLNKKQNDLLLVAKFKQHKNFFFNVGPPKEDIFSGHLLSPVFQSIYTHFTITGSCLLGRCHKYVCIKYNFQKKKLVLEFCLKVFFQFLR